MPCPVWHANMTNASRSFTVHSDKHNRYITYSVFDGFQNLDFQKQVHWFIFKYFTIGNIHIPVVWNAEVRQEGRKLPVIVFSHGLATSRFFYSTICMELASCGFVVAAIEHRWAWVTFVELKYHLEQETNLFNPN